jgi:hypothetical protein
MNPIIGLTGGGVGSYRNSGAVIIVCDGDGMQLGGLPTIGDHYPNLTFNPGISLASGLVLSQGHFDNQGPEEQNMILVLGGYLESE